MHLGTIAVSMLAVTFHICQQHLQHLHGCVHCFPSHLERASFQKHVAILAQAFSLRPQAQTRERQHR